VTRGVKHAEGYTVLRPQNVYRFDPEAGTIALLFDGAALGLLDLDGVDVYPDGRVAFSTATNVFVRGVYVKQQNVYTVEPDGNLTLAFDGESLGLQSLDDFALEIAIGGTVTPPGHPATTIRGGRAQAGRHRTLR
jgi:hypothetical protein